MATFPVDERTKANRYADRTSYNAPLVHSILSAAPVVHVSFTTPSSPFPSVLPMLAALATHNYETVLYLHGSSASRLATLCASPLPVTISATLVDGYVLALSPFSHSVNYRSAIAFGHAELVADEEELLAAMRAVTESVIPGRWEGSRVPPTKSEIKATGVMRVRIETASAKVRTGGAHSERRDEKDEETVGRVWAGVVPTWMEIGEPVEDLNNGAGDVPGYIEGWRRAENAKNKAHAEEGAVDA